MRKAKVYVGLLHYPMYNKRRDVITTSVTNLDLHDISRIARTYNLERFFVVHPSARQQELVQKIISYWHDGYGGTYNADRSTALQILQLASSLEKVKNQIAEETGLPVITVATDARTYPNTIAYTQLKRAIEREEKAYLLLFGTGWGMTEELVNSCDYILPPIGAESDYNHLSVRSAVAIIVDRILGEKWFL